METNLFLGQDGDIESLGVFGQPVSDAGAGQWLVRVAIRDTAARGLDESVGGQAFDLELLLSALGRARAVSSGDGAADSDSEDSGVSLPLILGALAVVGLTALFIRRRRGERP